MKYDNNRLKVGGIYAVYSKGSPEICAIVRITYLQVADYKNDILVFTKVIKSMFGLAKDWFYTANWNFKEIHKRSIHEYIVELL